MDFQKPNKKDYGWHDQQGFDDEPSGWLIEHGEQEYYKALNKYNAYIYLNNKIKEMLIDSEISNTSEFGGSLYFVLNNGNRYRLNLSKISNKI